MLETSTLLLPVPVRRHSKLYQATVARVIRITVEFVGGVRGRYPAESMDAQELAVRKLGGNAVELVSVVAVGFSPLWVLAAASDAIGGTRAYLDALVKELKASGVLAECADVSSVGDLLTALENTSGQVADTIDMPPLTVEHMRTSLGLFRQNAELVPGRHRLAKLFAELNEVSREPNCSLLVVSSLVAAGAIQAGIQLGHAHLFAFYGDSLAAIRSEGVSDYLERIGQPYLEAARRHLDQGSEAHTPRVLRRCFAVLTNLRKDVPSLLARIRRIRRAD